MLHICILHIYVYMYKFYKQIFCRKKTEKKQTKILKKKVYVAS